MSETVIGVFKNRDQADEAIDDLKDAGYDPKDISVMMKDAGEGVEGGVVKETKAEHVGRDTVSGAVTGGIIGGVAGLLIGVGAITIPGIGALLIGGPIASALGLTGAAATTFSGATTGAVAGGLIGALIGLGMPEREARVYDQHVREGNILVAVPTRKSKEDEAEDILKSDGAMDIKVFALGR